MLESLELSHIAAGLEQQHARAGAGELVGGHAATGAGADDDDVVDVTSE